MKSTTETLSMLTVDDAALGTAETRNINMYTLGALLLLAILLGAVQNVVDTVLGVVGLSAIIRKIPIVGGLWNLIIAVLMMYVLDYNAVGAWMSGLDTGMWSGWLGHIVNGAIVLGMIPVKDAVVSMVSKGLRA